MPTDPYHYMVESRIKTPHDRNTNYKLNMNLDYNLPNSKEEMQQYVTDTVYGGEPVIRNVNRDELTKIREIYNRKLQQMTALDPSDPHVQPGGQAFLGKVDHLLKNPKFQFARLEME